MPTPSNIFVGNQQVKRVVRNGIAIWKYMSKFVGYKGYSSLFHSDDGLVWTASTASTRGSIGRICLANGKYVVCAQDGGIRYSEDGVTFTDSTGSVGEPYAACFANGKFVAVGGRGAWLYSADATSWTQATTYPSTQSPRNVIWDGVRFVAMYSYDIAISYDGINWTGVPQTTTNKAYGTNGLAFLNGKVVCCSTGQNGYLYYTTPDPSPTVGSDNSYKVWTRIDSASPAYNVQYICLCAANGKLVAAGYNGVSCSTDGVTWSSSELNGTWKSVLWDGSLYRLYGESGKTATSPDGINWTIGPDITIPGSPTVIYSVVAKN